jgi:hypothetical protein
MTIPEHVVYQTLQDEVIVLDLDAGRYFSLAGSGARIWQLLCEGQTPAAIVATLVREYDVTESQLQTDVDELITSLVNRGLLVMPST